MSGPEDHIAELPEGDDLLAAEYVLGVLSHPDRLVATARLRGDAGFAALVSAWEARLAPLSDEVDAVQPPDLMQRIETRLFGTPETQAAARPGQVRSPFGWLRGWMAGAVLATLALVAVLVMNNPATGPILHATLASEGQPLIVAATFDGAALTVEHKAGPAAAAGSSYELWLIGPSGVPESLGVLTSPTHSLPLDALAEGVTLAVSLEPAGGSPTGAPTGPVLVTGVVTRL